MNDKQAALRWYAVIDEYSGLGLTIQTDKLPAISAIAKQIHNIRPDNRYLAGLWSSTLVHHLLWYPRGQGLTRPKIYCAPTWSWAPFPGQVFNRSPEHPLVKYVYHTEFLDAVCRPTSNDAYGQVESAQLILRAQLVECNIRLRKIRSGHWPEAYIEKLDQLIENFDRKIFRISEMIARKVKLFTFLG